MRRLRTLLLDSQQRPAKRLPGAARTTFSRALNGLSQSTWTGEVPCAEKIVPQWTGMGVFIEGRHDPIWAGEVQTADATSIGASDYAVLMDRRGVGPRLSARITAPINTFVDAALADARTPGVMHVASANWMGNIPVRDPGQPVYAPDLKRGTAISQMFSNMVSLGWWWTMDGLLLRSGRQNTCISGGVMRTARFLDPDSLIDAGPPASQVQGRNDTNPDPSNSSAVALAGGTFAAFPTEKAGYPPYRVDTITLPSNITTFLANRVVQDAFYARQYRFAVGNAFLRPEFIDLDELIPGRWFNIMAAPGTRLNAGLLGLVEGDLSPLTCYGILHTVNVTIDDGCITSCEIVFAAPDIIDPQSVHQLQDATRTGTSIRNSPPSRGAGTASGAGGGWPGGGVGFDGSGGWVVVGDYVGDPPPTPPDPEGCTLTPVGPWPHAGIYSYAAVSTTLGAPGDLTPDYGLPFEAWMTFNVNPDYLGVEHTRIDAVGLRIYHTGAAEPYTDLIYPPLETYWTGWGCDFDPAIGRFCLHIQQHVRSATPDAGLPAGAVITEYVPFLVDSSVAEEDQISHLSDFVGHGTGPIDFPCEFFTGGTPGGPGLGACTTIPVGDPGFEGVYAYAELTTDFGGVGATTPALGASINMWLTMNLDPGFSEIDFIDYIGVRIHHGGFGYTDYAHDPDGWYAAQGDYGCGGLIGVYQGQFCLHIDSEIVSGFAGVVIDSFEILYRFDADGGTYMPVTISDPVIGNATGPLRFSCDFYTGGTPGGRIPGVCQPVAIGPPGTGGHTSFGAVATSVGGIGSVLPAPGGGGGFYDSARFNAWLMFNVDPAFDDASFDYVELNILANSTGYPPDVTLPAIGAFGRRYTLENCDLAAEIGRRCVKFPVRFGAFGSSHDHGSFSLGGGTIAGFTASYHMVGDPDPHPIDIVDVASSPTTEAGAFPCEFFTGGTAGGFSDPQCEDIDPVGPAGTDGIYSYATLGTSALGGVGDVIPVNLSNVAPQPTRRAFLSFNFDPTYSVSDISLIGLKITTAGDSADIVYTEIVKTPAEWITHAGEHIMDTVGSAFGGGIGCDYDAEPGRCCLDIAFQITPDRWSDDLTSSPAGKVILALEPILVIDAMGVSAALQVCALEDVDSHNSLGFDPLGPLSFPCAYFTGGTPGGPGEPQWISHPYPPYP